MVKRQDKPNGGGGVGQLMKKLKSNSGETLIEALAALLVVAITISFLSIAVTTAAKLNKKVRENTGAFKYDGASVTDNMARVNIKGENVNGTVKEEVTVYAYDDYYYYGGTK